VAGWKETAPSTAGRDVASPAGATGTGAPPRWVRLAAAAAGFAIATIAVASWRVPRGTGTVGADVRFVVAPTGVLDVSPVGAVLAAFGMEPGSGHPAPSAAFTVRNVTGRALVVWFRARPSNGDLDAVLRVAIRGGSENLFDGDLGSLRGGTGQIRLTPGESALVRLRAWLEAAPRAAWTSRVVDVAVQLRTAAPP
jgi:hypothetical protein